MHYLVESGADTIDRMSPGKKALVLLELLISLEDSKCPTLFTIDGKLLMEGPYRHMHIDNDGRLRAETPQGLVYFTISPYFGKSC